MSRGQMRHLSKPLKTFCVFHRFFALPSNWLAGLCVSVHGMPGCREGKTGRRGSWIEMWLCCCQALPHELPFSFSTRTERRSVKGEEEEERGRRGGGREEEEEGWVREREWKRHTSFVIQRPDWSGKANSHLEWSSHHTNPLYQTSTPPHPPSPPPHPLYPANQAQPVQAAGVSSWELHHHGLWER